MFQMKNLTLKYPDLKISVDAFTLKPARNQNEMLYVQAPSGFGKTIVLRAIAGLEPCEGEFTGSTLPIHERNIGFVFQDQLLLSHLNATENVMLGLELRGVSKSDAKIRAENELKKVGLTDRLTASVHTLSGGERQRIAILRALIIRPSLLLLDEPYRGLDSDSKNRITEYFTQYLTEHATPVIWVSHENENGLRLVGTQKGDSTHERKFIYRS